MSEKLFQEGRRKLEELSGSKDLGRGKIALLTVLLRLCQLCCDPRLVGQEGDWPSSKKWKSAESATEKPLAGLPTSIRNLTHRSGRSFSARAPSRS